MLKMLRPCAWQGGGRDRVSDNGIDLVRNCIIFYSIEYWLNLSGIVRQVKRTEKGEGERMTRSEVGQERAKGRRRNCDKK